MQLLTHYFFPIKKLVFQLGRTPIISLKTFQRVEFLIFRKGPYNISYVGYLSDSNLQIKFESSPIIYLAPLELPSTLQVQELGIYVIKWTCYAQCTYLVSRFMILFNPLGFKFDARGMQWNKYITKRRGKKRKQKSRIEKENEETETKRTCSGKRRRRGWSGGLCNEFLDKGSQCLRVETQITESNEHREGVTIKPRIKQVRHVKGQVQRFPGSFCSLHVRVHQIRKPICKLKSETPQNFKFLL